MYVSMPKIGRPMGGGFSPLSLSPTMWLRDNVGLFQDAAGTIPAVADGDVVGIWKDASGASNHMSQATTANKPRLKLGVINGRNIIRFDGVNDQLTSALSIDITRGLSAYVVVALAASEPSYFGLLEIATNNGQLTYALGKIGNVGLGGASPYMGLRGNNSIRGSSAAMYIDNIGTAQHIIQYGYAGGGAWNSAANWNTSIDGAYSVLAVGAAIGGASAVTYLGSNAGTDYINGDIGEVLVYNRVLSAAQISQVSAYLKAKWGTP